jgi:hypothetical protein
VVVVRDPDFAERVKIRLRTRDLRADVVHHALDEGPDWLPQLN